MTDGANAYETVNKARHWQVFIASAIMVALIKATWNMKPLPSKVSTYARASVFYGGLSMVSMLLIGEYGPDIANMLEGGWNWILVLVEFVEGII